MNQQDTLTQHLRTLVMDAARYRAIIPALAVPAHKEAWDEVFIKCGRDNPEEVARLIDIAIDEDGIDIRDLDMIQALRTATDAGMLLIFNRRTGESALSMDVPDGWVIATPMRGSHGHQAD